MQEFSRCRAAPLAARSRSHQARSQHLASQPAAGGDTTPQKQPPMLLRVLSLPTQGLEVVLGAERFQLQRLALAAGKAGLALYGLFCKRGENY